MDRSEDPFIAFASEAPTERGTSLQECSVFSTFLPVPSASALLTVVARLHGFDLLDQPILSNIPARHGQLAVARTTVALRREMIGRDVAVLLSRDDQQAPIIIGVIEPIPSGEFRATPERGVTIHIDGERHVIEAEREIVLRCGDASITLTRAGKVIIKGNYILSRSTGYNKIKGAAIDIN